MTDDFLTRTWADHHRQPGDQFAQAVSAAIDTVRVGLARLKALQFDAPWRHEGTRRSH